MCVKRGLQEGDRVRGTGNGLSDSADVGMVTKIEHEGDYTYVHIITDGGGERTNFYPEELELIEVPAA